MKKLLIVCGLVLLASQSISAQEKKTSSEEKWYPTTIGVGVGVGTTGIVIDASTTINRWLGVRFGVDIMPKIKINKDLNLETESKNKKLSQMTAEIAELNTQLRALGRPEIDLSQYPNGQLPESMDVQGKLNNTTWHFLIDVYPIKNSSFHATVGAYFGPSEIISVYNKEDGFLKPIIAYNDALHYAQTNPAGAPVKQVIDRYGLTMIGAEMGDYFVTPNPAQNGDVKAYAKVNGFRPYLGVGFGRAVPKGRIGCQFDLGVQFWGKPKIYVPTYNKQTGEYQDEKIDADNAGDKAGKVLKTISKFSVYPVLNFRLVGRIL